jgi:hypothetical protein
MIRAFLVDLTCSDAARSPNMKAILTVTAVFLSLCMPSVGFTAAPHKANIAKATKTASERTGQTDAWRFKLYEGHWWYWLPSGRWAVCEQGRWLVSPPSVPSGGEEAKLVVSTEPSAGIGRENDVLAEDSPARPEEPESARLSAEYYWALGGTYNRHAAEDTQMLVDFADLGESVAAVTEHVREIRHDVEQSRRAYSRLAKIEADKPDVAEAVKKINQGLQKVTESVQQLEGQLKLQGAVPPQQVRNQTKIISALLNDSYHAAENAERRFHDMHSDDN